MLIFKEMHALINIKKLSKISVVLLIFFMIYPSSITLKESSIEDVISPVKESVNSEKLIVKIGLTDIPDETLNLEYYVKEKAFLQILEKDLLPYLKMKNNNKSPICFISYAWGDRYHEFWVKRFSEMLNKAGINVYLDRWIIKEGDILTKFVEKIENADWIIVVGTKLYLQKYSKRSKDFQEKEHIVRLEGQLVEYLVSYITEKGGKIIPILLEGNSEESLPFMLRHKVASEFNKNDYFEELLRLIRCLYNIDNRDKYFEIISEKFSRYSLATIVNITKKEKIAFKKKRKNDLIEIDKKITEDINNFKEAAFKKSMLLSLKDSINLEEFPLHPKIENSDNIKMIPIKPDFRIPSLLLERPDLITKIANKLTPDGGITTVALVGVVGIGGAGKTVLARQFAKSYVSETVWELNAERKESLMNSFQDLAKALAKTKNQKQELEVIGTIQNMEERETHLISLVRTWLKERQNWLLIYDNVENISTIKNYLPQDLQVWGTGKVILTTRDTNIQNTEYIKQENVIQVEELSNNEKLVLFSKIFYNKIPENLTLEQRLQSVNFLEKIPPFPLDVSAAAHYLKATNTSFNKYLENLEQHSFEFDSAQINLLKERGFYTKTRYNIITASLQNIFNIQKDFLDLALFISLLDSQNIPRSLLDRYKHNIKVGNFIFNLKKYSLITSESSTAMEQTFSIHRSTQSIMLAYLIERLKLNHHKQYLGSISKALISHMIDINDQHAHLKAYFFINHANVFLNYGDLLTNTNKIAIKCELGGMYYLVNDVHTSKDILEKVEIKKNDLNNKHIIARSLLHLGKCYLYSDCNKCEVLLRRSLAIYNKYFPENYITKAEILVHLGRLEIEKGACAKASKLFKEALMLYRKYTPQNYFKILWTLTYIGNVHRELGDFNVAKNKLEEAISLYNKYFPEGVIIIHWPQTLLGNVYRDLGDYQKSLYILKQGVLSLDRFKEKLHQGETFPWNTIHLAATHRKLGNYKIAKSMLEHDIGIFTKYYPDDQSYKAWGLVHLGNVYRDMGDYKEAKNLFEKALEGNSSINPGKSTYNKKHN